jgi:hypothetical protein
VSALSNILTEDPTLRAADDALCEKAAQEKPRAYVGMSSIGESCLRKTWYRFRFASREKFDAATLKRFADGHAAEAVQADRLRLVSGVKLQTHTPDGNQFRYVDHNGHFSGHCDGKITGILQAPKVLHIWEHKSVGEKKLNEFKKIKAEIGEKQALRKWNFQYWIQGILYMFYEGASRHYLTVSTPGVRDTDSCRTEADNAEAIKYIAKGKAVIQSDAPLDRLSNDPSYYECRYCSFSPICHGGEMPDRSCRTCVHSSPVENGEWHCARWGKKLTLDEQIAGCSAHLMLPKLVPGEILSATDSSITYRLKNGSIWTDSEIK